MRSLGTRWVWIVLVVFLATLAAISGRPDGLNNNEVEFTGAISSLLVNGEGVGTLFIRLNDYDLRVIVNSRTEIVDLNGDDMAMDDLKVEARVTITGSYSASGVLASKIRLEESPDNDFHVRGTIKTVENSGTGTVISLLSIRVIVTADTKIDDGTAALTASSLTPGLRVLIDGSITDSGWVASSIKIQTTEKKSVQVRFEGTVTKLSADSMEVAANGLPGNVTTVILEAKTRIVGTLAVGVPVYVKGTLNADLSVTAREVRVLQALEIKPDEKKLKVGESAALIVKLRENAAEDVTVALTVGDSTIASLSSASVKVLKGTSTAEFTVTGGPSTGSTEITAEALGQKATAKIKVGAVSENENENPQTSIVFAPQQIKLRLNESRDVVLLIKPPQKSAVSVTFEVTNGLVKVAGVTNHSNGAAAFKVTIQAGSTAGSDSVVATLPQELGGGKAELLVEVSDAGVDPSNKPKARIEFSPHQIKLGVDESLEVGLLSSQSFEVDVTIVLAATKGNGTITVPSTVVLAAGTKSVKVAVKGKGEGKATLTATMPPQAGGDSADLVVQVRK